MIKLLSLDFHGFPNRKQVKQNYCSSWFFNHRVAALSAAPGQTIDALCLRTCEIIRKSRLAEGVWLGHGTKATALSSAVLPMLRIALWGCLRSATSPEQRRPSQKHTQPSGREQKRPSGGVVRSVTACGGGAPSRVPCHPAFSALSRLSLIISHPSSRRRSLLRNELGENPVQDSN